MSLEYARTFRMIKVNNIGVVFMRDIGQGCLFYKKFVSGPIFSVASVAQLFGQDSRKKIWTNTRPAMAHLLPEIPSSKSESGLELLVVK